jgi:PAS domain S-box-containing protein
VRWHWYFSALALAGGACLAGYAAYVWRRRRASAGASLAVVLVAAGWWSLAYALELAATSQSTKLFWGDAKWLGISLLPAAWFAFIMQYTGRGSWVNRYTLAALAVPAVAVVVLLAIPATHDLVRYYPPGTAGDPDAIAQVGPLFWPFLVYADLVVWGSTALLVWTLTRVSRLYWRQSLLLIVTVLLPALANILHNLNVGPFGRVELTPFLFVLTGAVLVWGLFRFHLLDLAPIVRSSVFETMLDAVLVLDPYRRIVRLNPAAERVLGMPAAEVVGRQAETLLSVEPSKVNGVDQEVQREELVLGKNHHELTSAPLRDRAGRVTGRVIVLRDVTERHKAHGRLVRMDEQRRWLLRRLVATQEQERRQLAVGLRHDVEAKLRSASSDVDRLRVDLDRSDQLELLDRLRATITDSLGRLRQLAFELRPPLLDEVGLGAALEQYARRAGELAGFRVHVEDHLDGMLPVELQVIAYRIAQEALANVHAHAGAQRVAVWLESADDGMRMRVTDDGVGFLPGIADTGPGPSQLGLVSMREQAAIAGGTCQVVSAPGMGTTVEVWLPLSTIG